MSEQRNWSGRPVRVWGVQIACEPGVCPQVGDTVLVRAENGTKWNAPILYIQSHNQNTGRTVVLTPTKSQNPLHSS